MDTERIRRVAICVAMAVLVLSAVIVAAQVFTSDPTYIEGEVPVAVDNGPEVVIVADSQTEINMDDIWGTEELDIETEHGAITIGGDNGSEATINVDDIEGTHTEVTGISGGADWLYLNPSDKQRLDIRGDVDEVRFRDVGVNDGTTDIELTGTNGGTVYLRVYGLTANEDIALQDPNSEEILATNQTDGSGMLNTSVEMSGTSQDIVVRTTDDFTAPTLSNATPTGEVAEIPDNLSVDIAAEAYPADVEFFVNGSSIGTEEATGDGTVSISSGITDLGDYNWSAIVTDDVGQTDTINASFQTPDEITIYEEHDPTQVVDDSTLTIRFYTADGDIAIERETSNGTLDMQGLPNSEFVAFIESDNHYDRRVFLDSIFEQEELFILNSTEFARADNDAVSSRFVYTDLTGQFPRADTTLQVQRALDLNGNGTSEWRTVAGDFWGAGGEYEVILEHGARYRLFVENQETGDTDTVGTHIPTEDLAHEIRTSGLVQEAEEASGVYANAEMNVSDGVIDIVYSDPTDGTSELNLLVTSRSGDTTIFNKTVSGPLGDYREAVALNQSQLEEDWVVEIETEDHRSVIPVGSGSVDMPVNVPGWIMTFLLSMAVTFVGALYGPRTATLGAWAMVFVAAGVAMFGWAFSWAAVIPAALIAVGVTFYGKIFP